MTSASCPASLVFLFRLALATAVLPLSAGDKETTFTFFISGMECGACVAMISQSVGEVKGVGTVDLDIIGARGNISFDPSLASAHQVAQAVTDAFPVHGRPFVATMKLRIPEYATGGNAARVDAVFARRKKWVEVETLDRAKGEFLVHFQPLKAEAKASGPQGWNPSDFEHAIHDPAPKGLGLSFVLVGDEPAAPAGAGR